jgi:uncharacterized membrane protein YdjX (TVP38/TMEM64 family)
MNGDGLPSGKVIMHKASLTSQNLFVSNRSKAIAFASWLILIAGYCWYSAANDLSPIETTRSLISYLAVSSFAFPIYIAIYMLRPVVFFPATLVTMAAGFLYGPVLGILYALIASNLSSLVAYLIGRFFGGSFLSSHPPLIAHRPTFLHREEQANA